MQPSRYPAIMLTTTTSIAIVALLTVCVSSQEDDALAGLAVNIPGLPGQDYPIFAFPPETSFLCDSQVQGYYGDPEADCKFRDSSDLFISF